jgi:flagellar assembly factor FliW
MSEYWTRQFGTVEYGEEAVIEFPDGLPAFESDTRFVLLERPETGPVQFLQSLVHAELCFLALPVAFIDGEYRLKLGAEDRAALGIRPGEESLETERLLCLAILTVREQEPPTANLMAPVVIHRQNRRGRQVIQYDSQYSFEQLLDAGKESGC